MPLGPGKYDDWCTKVREGCKAAGAVVVVVGGDRGAGFSVQMPPEQLGHLPTLLRSVAAQIEKECPA